MSAFETEVRVNDLANDLSRAALIVSALRG